jgi:hypothetical protein
MQTALQPQQQQTSFQHTQAAQQQHLQMQPPPQQPIQQTVVMTKEDFVSAIQSAVSATAANTARQFSVANPRKRKSSNAFATAIDSVCEAIKQTIAHNGKAEHIISLVGAVERFVEDGQEGAVEADDAFKALVDSLKDQQFPESVVKALRKVLPALRQPTPTQPPSATVAVGTGVVCSHCDIPGHHISTCWRRDFTKAPPQTPEV